MEDHNAEEPAKEEDDGVEMTEYVVNKYADFISKQAKTQHLFRNSELASEKDNK